MALRDDIENDWRHIDGVETVTVTVDPQGDTPTEIEDVHALQRPVDRKLTDVFTSIAIQSDDCAWHVWSVGLNDHATKLKPGDEIAGEDGDAWTILACQWETLKTRWRCLCRKKAA